MSMRTMNMLGRIYLWLAIVVIVVSIFAYARSALPQEVEGSFYQWTTESGVVSFTDDMKRVPDLYKDQAVERTWEDVHASVEKRFTPESTRHEPYVWADPVLEPNPNWERDCTGHITVTQERVQNGEYNRNMFTVQDECGRVISITPHRPQISLQR